MILTSFGMRKFTALSAIAVMFSRISCIDISLLMTVTVTVHAFDTWTSFRGGRLRVIYVPDLDMVLVFEPKERNSL